MKSIKIDEDIALLMSITRLGLMYPLSVDCSAVRTEKHRLCCTQGTVDRSLALAT